MRTQRLFDIDARLCEFEAEVLDCRARDDGGFDLILDKTAFFPNEGGQSCDKGKIEGEDVLSVDEKQGVIIHRVGRSFEVGALVRGEIEWQERFRKMQNHTGEHIISGLVFARFGYNNVGFHLGSDGVSADFDGELTEADVREIERLANGVVFACRAVTACYPEPCELENMQYRSKLDITEGVRIVEIDGVDKCACCAPHVSNTGEVGLIKILDFMRYKGGVRVHMQCGFDALDDYNERCAQMRRVSMAISAKQCEIAEGVEQLLEEQIKLKVHLNALKQEIMTYKLERLEYTEASICIFDYTGDMLAARNFVNEAVTRTGRIFALFCGNDEEGYKYIMASETVDLKANIAEINAAIGGKGGGSSRMIQGSCNAKKADIEGFFSKENF